MTIPVLVPPASAVLSRPYVTPGMFRAYPTWLDLDDLIPGGTDAVQDDALWDVLLQASDWAVGVVDDMRLDAHWVQGETTRGTVRNGRVSIQPLDVPLRAITALSWGCDPSGMQAVTLPDPSMWIEDGRRVSWSPGGGVAQFRGPAIQFGARGRLSGPVFVNWSYVAGWPSAILSAPLAAGAMTVTVADPTGILPGDVLRIYDPGQSEGLTVASAYVPALPTIPPTVTAVPLAAGARYAHQLHTGITGMPRKILQSVIAYAVALLMREDVSEEEPASGFGPAARSTAGGRGGIGSGLINDAYEWLAPYRPVLRSA
jgi:hypothetical protein